jgi:hypothetical protein
MKEKREQKKKAPVKPDAEQPFEMVDPSEFIQYPGRSDIFLEPGDKPEDERIAMNEAFASNPEPIAPVLYDWVETPDGRKRGILDGWSRVQFAIKYGIEEIQSIRIKVGDYSDAIITMLRLNQNYHQSTLEQGMASATLFPLLSKGQGFRSDKEDISSENASSEKPDDVIGAILGITASKALRVRIVYEFLPDLLKQVDNKKASLNSAYKAASIPRTGGINNRHKDGDETLISDNTADDMENEIPFAEENTDTTIESEEGAVIEEESCTTGDVKFSDSTGTSGKVGDAVQVILDFRKDNNYILECPCCGKKIKLIIEKKR